MHVRQTDRLLERRLGGRHAVVTGGGGFLGSHLCDRLLGAGARVTVVDNFLTGRVVNLAHHAGHPRLRVLRADASDGLPVGGPVDHVLHLACPASPVDYLRLPVQTLRVGALGTAAALQLAERTGARLLLASTSEVYGDPEVHPQPETYWGNVNPVGPRAVYDESKRYAEAMATTYSRVHGVSVGIARIFNVYGPRLRPDDGRVVSTFLAQALRGEPLTVHGDGGQTRSLCYVADMVDGLLALLLSDATGPVNLGNPHEVTMLELAELVQEVVGQRTGVRFVPRPVDDPAMRCPDVTLARRLLGWEPRVPLVDGLTRTARELRAELGLSPARAPALVT